MLSNACQVETTPISRLVGEAHHIFIGSIVEIHWNEYENSLIEPQVSEGEFEIPRYASYSYRVVVRDVLKGEHVPVKLKGGYCQGAHVSGQATYVILTFPRGDDWGSKAFLLKSPQAKEIVEVLSDS